MSRMATLKAKPRAPAKSKPVPAKAAVRAKSADTAQRVGAGPSHDKLRRVEQFLYRQAEILDGRRWLEFVDLFTEDGIYWMPASPEQTTGDGVPSIFYDDRDLMTVRAKRVTHPHAWSQAPLWGTSHLVSNVTIEKEDRTGALTVRSRFHMMEFRRDTSRHFAGSYIHHLVPVGEGYRIKLQRVDMVNGQGPYEYVLQVWV
jgi:3-phenylpropionate/cinnamic acid dioxygenase small subunit